MRKINSCVVLKINLNHFCSSGKFSVCIDVRHAYYGRKIIFKWREAYCRALIDWVGQTNPVIFYRCCSIYRQKWLNIYRYDPFCGSSSQTLVECMHFLTFHIIHEGMHFTAKICVYFVRHQGISSTSFIHSQLKNVQ